MNIIIVNDNNDYYHYKYSLLPAIFLIHFQIVYFTSYTYTYTATKPPYIYTATTLPYTYTTTTPPYTTTKPPLHLHHH